jgi:hypothetical protein
MDEREKSKSEKKDDERIENLGKVLKDYETEVFDIFPSYPNWEVSSPLYQNQIDTESTVHRFIPLPDNYIILDPNDTVSEALFETFGNSRKEEDYINGLISVYVASFDGNHQRRVYSGASVFHNPLSEIGKMSIRRRWQFSYIVSPGDMLVTKLEANKPININNSHLDHRVLIKVIREDKKKEV